MSVTRRSRAVSALFLVGALGVSAAGVSAPALAADSATTPAGRLQAAAVQPRPLGPSLEAAVKAAKGAARPDGRTAVVVRLKDTPLASYTGGVTGLRATSPLVTGAPRLDVASRDSTAYLKYLGARRSAFEARARAASPTLKITQRLDIVVGGVAMNLPADDVAKIAADPQVASIEIDRVDQLQSEGVDVLPNFVRAPAAWAADGGRANAGEGVIVGVLDSGIWPEHPSLSDPDPSGKPYSAPRPTTDGSARQCDFSRGTNPGPAFTCNNKLIAAYTFLDAYEVNAGLTEDEYTSARDDDGHGTHTATTAAGNGGVAATIFGVDRGVVSGIAPRAHVIAYRTCAAGGCYSSDNAAAIAQAIIDDVDAINFSISGGSNPYSDIVSLAFLDAYNAGIFVAASAGNSGPTADSVDHREPWVTTVAASTGPRAWRGSATLTSTDGAALTVSGTTVTAALPTGAEVVFAGAEPYNDATCEGEDADGAFEGKVVICERGGNGRAAKGFNVFTRGAVGMILYNQSPEVTDQETDNHFLPTVHVQFGDGEAAKAFLTDHPGVTATLTSGASAPDKGDVIASFSSRGGPAQTLGVSKPDVTAPGVQVLAGQTPKAGSQGELFQAIAGTSMSGPHVAGAGAMLSALHPNWTPGQIHSALMTTSNTGTLKEDGVTPTDAFDDGSGRISLDRANDPYFTIDETGAGYVAKAENLQFSNYPSVYVPNLTGSLTVGRTLRSVSSVPRTYTVSVRTTRDFPVSVSPATFTLGKNATQTLKISMQGKDVPLDETRFATLVLTSGGRTFTLPVTAVRRMAEIGVDKSCAPNPAEVGSQLTCTVTMTNFSDSVAELSLRDNTPAGTRIVEGSVEGGSSTGTLVTGTATLPARVASSVDAAYSPGVTPAGYLPLDAFGGTEVTLSDEGIANFTVPAITLGGTTYNSLGIVSNGYLVLGGGTGADVQYSNLSPLPNPETPNNVIAPFWSDLNPAAGGKVFIAGLTDGENSWIAVEFRDIPEFSTPENTHSFEVWLGYASNGGEDVTVVYGDSTGTGDGGIATVGVENPVGTQGTMLYYNGEGQLPEAGDEILVTGTPGVTSSATVTYTADALAAGTYATYAQVTSNLAAGIAIGRFAGSIVRATPE